MEKFYENIDACLIPHAGKDYAGKARACIFDKIIENKNKYEYLIYIATVHNISEKNITYTNGFLNYQKIDSNAPSYIKNEHSYAWIREELKQYFNDLKHIIIYPGYNDNTLIDNIVKFIKNNKTLLIVSTDLLHYGEYYGNINSINFPVRLNKIIKEEYLIESLMYGELKDLDMICGKNNIKIFCKIRDEMKWYGKPISYYDSSHIGDNFVDDKETTNFVSYVSIAYSTYSNNFLNNLDIKIALDCIRNNIYWKLTSPNNNYWKIVKIPSWSFFNKIYNGIFISSKINGETNCCVGDYENEINTAQKIINVSNRCISDNIRWGNFYDKNKFSNYVFDIEILDNKKNWLKYNKNNFDDKLVKNGAYGVYLKLHNGFAATYLPIVFKENPDNVENLMISLTEKAGGTKSDWDNPNNEIYVYKTFVFMD